MPRIPDVQQMVQRQDLPAARINVQASPQAFGAGIGAAMQDTGEVIQKFALDKMQREDTLAAKQAFTLANDSLREYLYGEQGVFKMTGANAQGLSKKGSQALEKIARTASEKLNNTQRELFDRFWTTASASALDGIYRHEANEFQKLEDETDQALVDSEINTALEGYRDQRAVTDAVSRISATIDSTVIRKGHDPMWGAAEKKKATTAIYTGIIDRMMSEDHPELAKQIFQTYKKDIDPGMHAKITEEINRVGSLVKAQDMADKLVGSGMNESQALAEARKKTSGKDEALLVSEIKARYSDMESAKYQAVKTEEQELGNRLLNAKTAQEALSIANSAQDFGNRTRLLSIAERFAQAENPRAAEVKESPENLYKTAQLRKQISNGAVTSEEQIVLLGAQNGLTNSQIKELQKDFRDGFDAIEPTQFEAALRLVTGDPDAEMEKYPKLWDMVVNQLPTGQKATFNELKQAIATQLKPGIIPDSGIFGRDNKYTYQQSVIEGRSAEWLPVLDDRERKTIIDILQRGGIKRPTDKDIGEYYRAVIMGIPVQGQIYGPPAAPKPSAREQLNKIKEEEKKKAPPAKPANIKNPMMAPTRPYGL